MFARQDEQINNGYCAIIVTTCSFAIAKNVAIIVFYVCMLAPKWNPIEFFVNAP